MSGTSSYRICLWRTGMPCSLSHAWESQSDPPQSTISFFKIPNPFSAGRYHSLIISKNQIPDCLEIMAESQEGEIMAIRHRVYLTFGVQFHPESILTEQGLQLIDNFITLSYEDSNKQQYCFNGFTSHS